MKFEFQIGKLYKVIETFSSVSPFEKGEIVKFVRSGFSAYDESWIYHFIDNNDNELIWMVSDRPDLPAEANHFTEYS